MTISAKILLDSVNPDGDRLTTLLLEYPRFIHSEFMTHRVFSRNAASSRAVPTDKMIERILEDPAMPHEWGRNNPGMQSKELMDSRDEEQARMLWLEARNRTLDVVQEMRKLNPHKQIINRLLEPWMHIQVVVSATDWSNFFELRDHPNAQPEIRMLAQEIKKAREGSKPKMLHWGRWHIPLVENVSLPLENLLKISTARCARVSYFNALNDSDYEKDYELHDRLVGSTPIHASPTEHQAVAIPGRSSNFSGWKQYRHIVEMQALPKK